MRSNELNYLRTIICFMIYRFTAKKKKINKQLYQCFVGRGIQVLLPNMLQVDHGHDQNLEDNRWGGRFIDMDCLFDSRSTFTLFSLYPCYRSLWILSFRLINTHQWCNFGHTMYTVRRILMWKFKCLLISVQLLFHLLYIL